MFIQLTFLVVVCYASQLDRKLIRKERAWKDKAIISASGEIGAGQLDKVRWVTGPFSDCTRCEDGSKQFRWVNCQNAFTRDWVDTKLCNERWKPTSVKACDCRLLACVGNTTKCSFTNVSEGNPSEENDFDEIGCFKKPVGMTPKVALRNTPRNSYDCHSWNNSRPCHGGLPFYAVTSASMSPSFCFSFCIEKGLDIFALDSTTSPGTCRCGATTGLAKIWDHSVLKVPLANLVFNASALASVDDNSAVCPLRVFRYAGFVSDGTVPAGRSRLTASDVKYQDQIVCQCNLTNSQLEDLVPATKKGKSNVNSKFLDLGLDPLWERPCYPFNCGAGGGPWGQHDDGSRTSESISVNAGAWQEYSIIKYFFEPMVDKSRKEAFREASFRWMHRTCIVFQEVVPPVQPPAVYVSIEDVNSCWAWPLGKPDAAEYAQVNLGWCSNMMHVGNIMHELGHILGMNHKQQRPDAGQSYMGRGPYLKIHWNHISEASTPQYEPVNQDYMGSRSDGPGDPFDQGYAPYDFESIMHYPNSGAFQTIPASAIKLVGNRDHLSDLDVLQINDMYQCRRPATGTTTATTRTTTTTATATATTTATAIATTTTSKDPEVFPDFVPPLSCPEGCALWSDLASDRNSRNQTVQNARWRDGATPAAAQRFCARPHYSRNSADGPWCYCRNANSSNWGFCTPAVVTDRTSNCVDFPAVAANLSSQSSARFAASNCIDGLTFPSSLGLCHTKNESNPHLQLDLGVVRAFEVVNVTNRYGDCCFWRLGTFQILIGNTTMPSTQCYIGSVGQFPYPVFSVPCLGVARYVRLQIIGKGILNLQEVTVQSCTRTTNTV